MRDKRGKRSITPLNQDDQAFVCEVLEKYHKRLIRTINHYVGLDYPDAVEDILQDTFAAACAQVEDLKRYDSPEALLVTIAARTAQRELKRLRRELPLVDDDYPAPQEDIFGLEECLPNSTPPKDREILTLVYEHRDTPEEVARDKGIKPETIRQRLKRARDRLQKKLLESK